MKQWFWLTGKGWIKGGNRIIFSVFLLIAMALFSGRAIAIDFDVFDKPLSVNGYINQGIQFGVAGDHYDTKSGFQQALMQALLEIEYHPTRDVKVFVTGQLVKDWAYDILDSNDDWKFRRFDKSRSEMSLYSDYEDYLKECHVSWIPGNFNIRVGKQILAWGRMDGVRIMDQINPRDTRRGFADVEFETSIMPIWLAKTEYFVQNTPGFINDLGLEFTFNPNADFIGNKMPGTGNDVSGIYSADVTRTGVRVGYTIDDFEEPDSWNSDGYEYAARIKGTFTDHTYFTLNYFDGVSNSAANRTKIGEGAGGAGIILDDYTDDKGRMIVHPLREGFYADQQYAGFTFSREFESLFINWLGGIAPLVRGEAIYEFDTTFTTSGLSDRFTGKKENYEEHDAIFWGLGVDWKFKWDLLNPRRYFAFVPQFSHRHIKDYPSGYYLVEGGPTVAENLYSMSIRMSTFYFHDKLQPFIFYKRDIRSDVAHETSGSVKSDLWLFKLIYTPDETWKYTLQLFMPGNDGFDKVDHQDNLSFTISYQF